MRSILASGGGGGGVSGDRRGSGGRGAGVHAPNHRSSLRRATLTVRHTDEYGRTRTKVIVTKRSYLDGGTEVMPGDVQNNLRTDFIDMNQQPTSVISNNNVVPIRPVSDPFYLPGKNNPYFAKLPPLRSV